MAEEFGVIPPELRRRGEDLRDASSRVKAVMASLRTQIAGEGAGIGCALAPGDANSFHAHCDHVQETVHPADTSVLDYWGNYLIHAADAFQRSDQG